MPLTWRYTAEIYCKRARREGIKMERIICLAIGYLFGMFQTSYIIGKIHHMDIRQYGSGNAGTTNALRTLGKKRGQ